MVELIKELSEPTEDNIVSYIDRVKGVSFVDLKEQFPALFGGDFTYVLKSNVAIWGDFTEMGAKMIQKLIHEKKIFFHPVDVFIYMMDGAAMPLPIIRPSKKNKEMNFTEPHWLPVVLNTNEWDGKFMRISNVK